MELEKLQQEKIDGILFKKKIDEKIERQFTKRYKKIGINGLTESFSINLQCFKDIIANKTKKNCKFYYIEKNNKLSLGLSLSDTDQCEIIYDDTPTETSNNDILYALDGENFIKEDIQIMVNNFDKGLGAKLLKITKSKDTLIFYTLNEIDEYIKEIEKLYPTIYSLKFTMIQYSSKDANDIILADFADRDNRIAFSVHALYNKNGNLYGESEGYDLGNLRP